ncbi:nucleotidyl transferase AbiEii/AbiGii toxin family protein [Actinoallomurus soli]|uniref:nucleotidyl transferase AbiEii/AbiGii toxin family protein n=1 Tax=Actinoallomurus soli TaxID=2952535 RepID=UPI0020924BAB|nr:nucleotidyl transferase AbiEii/AbiGii toxin family protein [Actinoallomurus soli]MCO5971505.1 nucleotidyl transferase AbiEii/AbiGii toxin family protein [Actinoallomurus soli]
MEGVAVGIDFPPFHRRLIEAGLDLCEEHGLFLAGGYAMKAHGLVDRPSQDIDFATANPLPVEELTERVVAGYRAKGFEVVAAPGNYRFARLVVTDPLTSESCEVDLMKATLRVSPIIVDSCPVLGFDDAIGLKMRALHDRGIARDLIDAAALAGEYSFERLEWLCRSHEPDFSLRRLASRLEAAELRNDAEFEAYGLTLEEVRRVKRFAAEWAQDINLRLLEEEEVDLEL